MHAIHSEPTWARSRGGRPISRFHSVNAHASHPLIFIGGVHGDEPEGVALAEATLSWLKTESKSGAVKVPWVLIPCLNPDGYATRARTNAAGVDLNRNYPARSWSPVAKEPRYSPGPSPGSEPEVQALVALIKSTNPRLIIHCHSWNPCIVLTGEPARADAERLVRASGYPLQDSIGYETPGSLSQFAWHDLGIPVICIEEKDPTPLDQVWPHFAAGVQAIFGDSSPRRPDRTDGNPSGQGPAR
jgi:murein peptide amidase A